MTKKILIVLGVIVVLLFGVCAVLSYVTPTDCLVEREVLINKPKSEVFAYAKMLKNQNDWGPWFKKDPTMEQEFRGTDGTVGFTAAWNGTTDEIGAGEQEIKNVVEGERIETQLRFKRPFESSADAYITTEAAGTGQTKVRWGFTSSVPRPMNLMLLVVDIDDMVGKDFGEGLASMKEILENR